MAVNKDRPIIQSHGYNGSEPTRICPHCGKEKSLSEFGFTKMQNFGKSLWNKGRTSIQGQALYVRSARQTARTIEVRAVLRYFVPYKGLHPLRRCAAIPAHFAIGAIC